MNKIAKLLLRRSYRDIIGEELCQPDFAEDYEYKPVYENREELIEATWKDYVKFNRKEARFIGKEKAVAIIKHWLAKEDEAAVRKIVINY